MKKGKNIFIALGIIVLVVAAGVVFLVSNLDSIVKGAIEKYGSQATGTAVKVSSLHISLKKGEGSIGGLRIANPSEFSDKDAFELKNITIGIETGSLTINPVVIRSILVSDPHVNYEINRFGKANINEIIKNMKRMSGGEPSGKKGVGQRRTFLIKNLVIEKGRVDAGAAALSDKPFTAELPRIQLTNIGGQGGSSPSELAAQVLGPLANRAIAAASETGVLQYLGKSAEEGGNLVKKSLKEKTRDADEETAGKARNALEKFLGK